jgi:hypothetical protein
VAVVKFGIDAFDSTDWDNGPALSTVHHFNSLTGAEVFAEQWMRGRIAAGIPECQVQCVISSDQGLGDYDDTPVYEHQYGIHDGEFVDFDAEQLERWSS